MGLNWINIKTTVLKVIDGNTQLKETFEKIEKVQSGFTNKMFEQSSEDLNKENLTSVHNDKKRELRQAFNDFLNAYDIVADCMYFDTIDSHVDRINKAVDILRKHYHCSYYKVVISERIKHYSDFRAIPDILKAIVADPFIDVSVFTISIIDNAIDKWIAIKKKSLSRYKNPDTISKYLQKFNEELAEMLNNEDYFDIKRQDKFNELNKI